MSLERAGDPREATDARDVSDAITRQYMARLEAAIYHRPEQYLWTRRWAPDAQAAPTEEAPDTALDNSGPEAATN